MRRLWLAWIFGVALAACAVPGEPPSQPPVFPPTEPPQPPQPPEPPSVPPVDPPASVTELVAKIKVGMTPAEVAAAVGSEPIPVPRDPGAPWTVRWDVRLPEGRFLVFAVFGTDGKAVRAGSSPIVEPGR